MRRLPLVTLAVLACLTACSPDRTLAGPEGEVDCTKVIDDQPGINLGWVGRSQTETARVEDGRCHLELAALGTITAGALDGEGSARARYDEACGRLTVDADLTKALLGPATGCAQGLDPATETGPAELVLLTEDDVVLQLRVVAKAPVDVDHLTEGMRALADNAEEAW